MPILPFVDNRQVTLAKAVGQHIGDVRHGLDVHLDIASGFFDLPGFLLLAEHLREGDEVQLLLGAEPPREADLPAPKPGDPTGPARYRHLLQAALSRQVRPIGQARDLLPFDAATDAAVAKLHALLASGSVQVRRVKSQFLTARGIVVRSNGGGAFVGEANLTRSGLTGGPTVILGHQGTSASVGALWNWFDATWETAAPFDLGKLFHRLTADCSPYLIFLRVLYALYGEEVSVETTKQGEIPITTFQLNGVQRAERIISEYGGVLIADGVGLGKTFTAGEIMRRYRLRRQRVLLICPAALRDGSWKDFQNRFDIRFETLSYEQLASDIQFGGMQTVLATELDDYQLIVVDEAHNYRNPDAPMRAGVLRRVLAGRRKDVVLLTATSVNNSLWDLYHLFEYFLRRDGALADRGILSIQEKFKEAEDQGADLQQEVLYKLIDTVTVKRTRQFVKKHYKNEQIKLLDGRTVPLTFPVPVVSSIQYSLDATLPGFIGKLEAALMPVNGKPRLSLARYQPEKYLKDAPAPEGTVIGLLRSAMLKRFESSVHAFATTMAKMVQEHEFFLEGLDDGVVYSSKMIREVSAADDADADDLLDELAEKHGPGQSAGDFDAKALRAAVAGDLAILKEFHGTAAAVAADTDPKLKALIDELIRIAEEANRDGIDDKDQRRNRKVLIFSYFSDTVDWILDRVTVAVKADPRLKAYRSRIAAVSGTESRNGVTRLAAVAGFSPESAGRGQGKDEFDILIATDVLAEGLNLQQCRNIINFDLPWNPMRMVQRHGRIDRIGSPHPRVFLRTFFPDKELDRLLSLEARVKRKLSQAAASVGVEARPIENAAEADLAFAENQKEIKKLYSGDAAIFEEGGTEGTTQSGESYRLELQKALLTMGDEIIGLPWRSGSGLVKGARRGHFFCATVGDRPYLGFVPEGTNDPKKVETEEGGCLRLIGCTEETPRVVPDDLLAGAYAAWAIARRRFFDDWTRETDPANLHPKVSPLLRELAEFLRKNPPADATAQTLERTIATISAPLSRRNENQLRVTYQAAYPGNKAKATAVAAAINELGLEPAQPLEPRPPITEGEVHLICWMAIEAEA